MTDVAVIADDLSGAVEAAAAFLLRTTRISVQLTELSRSPRGVGRNPSPDVWVIDTDSRELLAPAAAERAAVAIRALAEVPVVVKKIDSLLRGNIAAELQTLRLARPHLVVATALPAAGRAVRHGQVWVGDRPLHESGEWRAEAGERPLTVAHALHPIPTTPVPLAAVRDPDLPRLLREILSAGTVPVCDAETDADLDRIAAAATDLERAVLVGSAGIAAAVARRLPVSTGPAPAPSLRVGPLLVVVGSAAPGIVDQLAVLAGLAEFVVLDPVELLAADGDAAALAAVAARVDAAAAPVVVVAVDGGAGVDPGQARSIVRGLSGAVTAAAGRAAGLVLTGGETARAVLDRLGVAYLRPLDQVHHGAVVSVDDHGRLVATRPGSFGGPASLREIVGAVRDSLEPVPGSVFSPGSQLSHPDAPHPTEEPA